MWIYFFSRAAKQLTFSCVSPLQTAGNKIHRQTHLSPCLSHSFQPSSAAGCAWGWRIKARGLSCQRLLQYPQKDLHSMLCPGLWPRQNQHTPINLLGSYALANTPRGFCAQLLLMQRLQEEWAQCRNMSHSLFLPNHSCRRLCHHPIYYTKNICTDRHVCRLQKKLQSYRKTEKKWWQYKIWVLRVQMWASFESKPPLFESEMAQNQRINKVGKEHQDHFIQPLSHPNGASSRNGPGFLQALRSIS